MRVRFIKDWCQFKPKDEAEMPIADARRLISAHIVTLVDKPKKPVNTGKTQKGKRGK